MPYSFNSITRNQPDYGPFECVNCCNEMHFDDKKSTSMNPVLGNGPRVELRCRSCFENWKLQNRGCSKSMVTGNKFEGEQYQELPDQLQEIWKKAYQPKALDSKTGLGAQLLDAKNETDRLQRELRLAREQIRLLGGGRPPEPRPRSGSCCIVRCFRRLSRGFFDVLQSIRQIVSNCLRFLARTVYYCLRSSDQAILAFLRIFFRGIYRFLRFCDRLVLDFFHIFSRIFSNCLYFS